MYCKEFKFKCIKHDDCEHRNDRKCPEDVFCPDKECFFCMYKNDCKEGVEEIFNEV